MIAQTFHTLITQPTTLCNLDCGYCYLPNRKTQNLMFPAVAKNLAAAIREQGSSYPVDVVWHCGEPMTSPITHMRKLLAPFESLRRDGLVKHGIQTNATLVDDAWCDLFTEHGFQVGVSIDGPAVHNAARLDWAGGETFTRTMRGVGKLREAGLPYTAICVVTLQTIGHADELEQFFTGLGCASVAFNLEEREGLNSHRQTIDPDQAQAFWARLWQLRENGSPLAVRDLDRFCEWLDAKRSGDSSYGTEPTDPLPTVSYNGDVVILSPELLGVQDHTHWNFKVGNVLRHSLPEILRQATDATYVREFRQGLAACEATCEFFDYCRGANAGNRYFEHGSFDIAETAHCRNSRQALVLAAAAQLEAA